MKKGRLNWPYVESSLQEIFNSCLKITHPKDTAKNHGWLFALWLKILYFIPKCRIVVLEKIQLSQLSEIDGIVTLKVIFC